mgnify:CR=1 FL=1
MLSPKKVKYRKKQKGRMKGVSRRGSELNFGEFVLQAVEVGTISNKQIEAARIAMTRHVKRGGKMWIRIFPDKPFTKKPAEVRMGKGKGEPEAWVASVKPGTVLYELGGVTEQPVEVVCRLGCQRLKVNPAHFREHLGHARDIPRFVRFTPVRYWCEIG